MTVETRGFRCQPKQRDFLRTAADLAVYGGSAGSGKSWSLLYQPIFRRHHLRPGFYSVVFRRTSPEITNPGGLWDEAAGIYPYFGGEARVGSLEYRFPSGARVALRHLQHEEDKFSWQGAQVCGLNFDELAHFQESQFWYLLSRNRSTCGVRPYVRATCNPDPGWVKDLLGPWVDDGFDGRRAASGEIRWFIRVDGKIRWVDPAHPDAKSLTFIRASIYDNAILLERNPEYLATLKALPSVERARLLDGDWNVRREGLVYVGFDACLVDARPHGLPDPSVGSIDFGYNNPFAAIWGHLDHDDVLWITGCRYVRQCTMPIHAEAIPKGINWWCDPAQPESIAQLRAHGHHALPCVHRPVRGASGEMKKPILGGIDMVSERIRTGRLRIVRSACLPLVRELGMYRYDEAKSSENPIDEDNHACDALRYLCVGLDRNRDVPAVSERAEREAGAAEPGRLEAERVAAIERDRAAQADPEADRWWGGSE
jgi:Terminase large subunit, T4likevirus-type, N-terminal